MATRTTEELHEDARGLDGLPPERIAAVLIRAQAKASSAVVTAEAALAEGARAMARSVEVGGRLVYAGAGSAGLMAAADALELSGTFGIDADRITVAMAGGQPKGSDMPGGTEDDVAEVEEHACKLTPNDTVIAVSASGTTPYTVAFAKGAAAAGATVIGVANSPGAELFNHSSVAVHLPTPPEVVAGSTRLGAGTAQKIALNTMSTIMGVLLGHVHDGMMVNVRADNAKLRARAAGMVAAISGASERAAESALSTAEGDVKTAVLVAAGAPSPDVARAALEETGGRLRAALARL
ncbi:MAG: N-acetylmuramic acid 6-phosphate etherase [Pseudomonadota bacterium]